MQNQKSLHCVLFSFWTENIFCLLNIFDKSVVTHIIIKLCICTNKHIFENYAEEV